MKKLIPGVVAIMLLATTILSGCGSSSTQQPVKSGQSTTSNQANDSTKVIELKLGHSGSTTHHYQATAEKFAQIVSQKTNGQIKISIFPADQLGAGPNELESVKVGTQDLVITPDAFLANVDPLFNALGMPYQFSSWDQVKKIPGSNAAKFLEDKLKAKGLVLLGWNANGFRLMTSKKPIVEPQDLKGMKFRGAAKLITDVLATLGANPTNVAMAETYSALQTGTIDGQENPTTNIISNKLYEVQKYLALTRHQYVTEPLVMNKAKFDSLSPEFQKILLDAGAEVAAQDVQATLDSESKELEQLKQKGMQVTEPDIPVFKAAVQPVYDKYAQANGADWGKLINMIKEITK